MKIEKRKSFIVYMDYSTFSSIGGSALTTNRLSVFIWIITTLVILKISNKYFVIRLFKKIKINNV